jgi:hypothetical protein
MNQLPMSEIRNHIISVTFGISVIEIWLLFDYWGLDLNARLFCFLHKVRTQAICIQYRR